MGQVTFNGLLQFSPSEEAIWIVPLTITFILWVIYQLMSKKFQHRISIFLAYLIIPWNLLTIYSHLFIIYLPLSNDTLKSLWYGMWGLALLDTFYLERKNSSLKASSEKIKEIS